MRQLFPIVLSKYFFVIDEHKEMHVAILMQKIISEGNL